MQLNLTRAAKARTARGFSLVELMVSMAVGLVLLLGLTTLFVNNSRTRDEIERANQQTDNGRYAIQAISDDLRNAGYYAQFDPSGMPLPGAMPDPCSTSLTDLRNALPLAVQGYDRPATPPGCLSDVREGTDILVVRRAATCEAGSANCDPIPSGAPQLQASACNSTTQLKSTDPFDHFRLDTDPTALTLNRNGCTAVAPTQQYHVRIYFVANNDKPGDGIPTLKRAELGAGGFTIVPLVEGIQDLQFEYGIDNAATTTGAPAVFTPDPDLLGGCSGAACIQNWRNTVAVRVHLLARNTQPSSNYEDKKGYTLGLLDNGSDYVVGPFDDAYRRHAYLSTVRLHNVAGRLTP